MTFWYRYVDIQYAGYDPWAEFEQPPSTLNDLKVELREYEVLKETPKGVWLYASRGYGFRSTTFVRQEARKRFAAPTKDEALRDFIARKQAQVRIYSARLARAERAIELATKKTFKFALSA